jgi:hypothetical protein
VVFVLFEPHRNIGNNRKVSIFNPQNLKQQTMVNTRPQPSAPISFRIYVLVVMDVRKDPEKL